MAELRYVEQILGGGGGYIRFNRSFGEWYFGGIMVYSIDSRERSILDSIDPWGWYFGGITVYSIGSRGGGGGFILEMIRYSTDHHRRLRLHLNLATKNFLARSTS